jgi:cytochrome c oxidase subunit 2
MNIENCLYGRKVANINAIRTKSADLVAKGETVLDPYTFDYLLLCNKICGASHHNMQMKIIVDTRRLQSMVKR